MDLGTWDRDRGLDRFGLHTYIDRTYDKDEYHAILCSQ